MDSAVGFYIQHPILTLAILAMTGKAKGAEIEAIGLARAKAAEELRKRLESRERRWSTPSMRS